MPSHADRVRRHYVNAIEPASDAFAATASQSDWLGLIRAEYLEISGLRLTQAEVQQLWDLEPSLAGAILSALVSEGLLTRTTEGTYILRDQD